MKLSSVAVKLGASGRCIEVLVAAGIPDDVLDGNNHPCPRPGCGGEDSFQTTRDVNERGAVICRQCFNKPNGDVISAVQWWRECSSTEALEFISDVIGLTSESSPAKKEDVIERVARANNMPLESFSKFGVMAAKRNRTTVARVPAYDGRGEIHSHFDLAPQGGELNKGMFARGNGKSGMFFPGRKPKPEETWYMVEGVKDAAALDGLGFNATGLPRCEMPVEFAELFRGVNVVLVPDLDEPSHKGAHVTARRLFRTAGSLCVVRLPGEIRKCHGHNVRDCLNREKGQDLVREAIANATPWEPPEWNPDAEDGRPRVQVTLDEAGVANQVLRHLSNLGHASPWIKNQERYRVYQRGGKLVYVARDPLPPSTPRIVPLSRPIVRERIGQAVELYCEKKRKDEIIETRISPPLWLVANVYERGEYPANIRYLSGIIRCPALRPDGSVIQAKGYDAATGLIYDPAVDYPSVNDFVTRAEAVVAANTLLELVADFPFMNEAHKSAWLATVLTLVARPAIAGGCPLFAFDATTPGSGKTKLCDLASLIAYGTTAPRRNWPRDDEEVRKVITAVCLEGIASCLFDNVARTLGSASLDGALTSTEWSDRVLGKSETTGTLPMSTVFMATGNNLVIGADTVRRTLYCRLESFLEHPEDRSDFKHLDLLGHVREKRGALAVCAVTILRAYFAAGKPAVEVQPWQSFPEWDSIVRAAIVWCDLADPIVTRDALSASDRSGEVLGLLHAGIEEINEGRGVTSGEIDEALAARIDLDHGYPFPTLRAAIVELCGARKGKTDTLTRQIGNQLKKYAGRVKGGKRIASRDGHGGVKRWYLESLEATSPSTRKPSNEREEVAL